jgi:glucose-1-phosphate thymidylyltransferase
VKAFILAGGFATRLWPLTESRAKPLLPIAGKPMLNHIIEQIPAGIPITVSTNAAFEESFHAWKKTIEKDVSVRIERTRNDDEKLGTLGATAQWIEEEKINDDILLLTGDNYFGFDMQTFIDRFNGSALVAAYDIGDASKASAFGTIITEKDGISVRAFEEKPKVPKSSLVSTGCSILPKSVIPDLIAYAKIKPDNVGGIFEELLRLKKPVSCFIFKEPWFDIGSFEAYLEATRALVGGSILKEEGASLEKTECEGSIVIGKNSVVKDSRLRDTVFFEGCIIEDCILENCIIDDNCVLKGIDLSGKMLRAGTKLIRE